MGNENGEKYGILQQGDVNSTLENDKWAGNSVENDRDAGILSEEGFQQIKAFQNNNGMMRVTPLLQKQHYTYWTVAYIAAGEMYPQTQTFPICDVDITPHQISFDFFDTTEGKIGVSNATEKHMIVECDVYLTDLIYYYWNHGKDQSDFKGLSKPSEQQNQLASFIDRQRSKGYSDNLSSSDVDKILIDFESTEEFAKFRHSFLQQHSGWICTFTSNVFGSFKGVFTELKFNMDSGETAAKFHLKIEEAIFTENYSSDGKKESDEAKANTSALEGTTTDSGDAIMSSDISDTNTN